MSEQDRIAPKSKDEDAYRAYYDAFSVATGLRSMVTMKGPGTGSIQKKSALTQFKRLFDNLYMLTRNRTGLGDPLLKEVSKWMYSSPESDDKTIMLSIELFERYTKELEEKEIY